MNDLEYEIWTNGGEAALSLIESLAKDAYEKSCFGDWSALDDIKLFKQHRAYFLYQLSLEMITHNLIESQRIMELDVYKWFDNHYKDVLGDEYSLITVKNDPKNIPDRWLSYKGEHIPVECKRGSFDSKALAQLERYMDFYMSRQGVAVGKDCTCDLPKNITFIRHSVKQS